MYAKGQNSRLVQIEKKYIGDKMQCYLKSQQLPTRKEFVYKIQVNPIQTIWRLR